MLIEQFEDKGLAHYSYVVISEGEAALIDPARDPAPYYEVARRHNASITAVLETHSHADFVSGHREIAATTGATIHVSEFMNAGFPHKAAGDGDLLQVGQVIFKVIYTPGHSYDSLCFLLLDPRGNEHALFTGDTLFIGDVGRPDLRESIQNDPAGREELATAMYHTIHEKLYPLKDEILVYPAHGAGTLCGKSLSEANSSTIGAEKAGNYAFRTTEKNKFVEALLSEQPFVPRYFSYDVALNQQGAPTLGEALQGISWLKDTGPAGDALQAGEAIIIDTRPRDAFRKNHLKGSFNIPDGLKFETWLGSILAPNEAFYLLAQNTAAGKTLLGKIAKIGYESQVSGVITGLPTGQEGYNADLPGDFEENPENYTVIDARNRNEYAGGAYYTQAINIPLPELRQRAEEIPLDKPLAVHCAAGYRSAIATSILRALLPQKVYDIGNAIERKKPLR